MRGQGSFLVKNTALRRVLFVVLTVLLPFAALVSYTSKTIVAADPVKLHLDHWGNGGSPQTVAKWRDGNLHWTNSHYQEGDADPTRMIMDNLTPGESYKLTFTFMAAKKQAKIVKHGHDFLTNYTFSEYTSYTPNTTTAPTGLPNAAYPDPCLPRVQGGGKPPNVCTLGSKPTDVYAIPLDTFGNGQLKVSDRQNAAGVPQYFSMWNGDITNVSGYTYSPTTVFKDTTYVTLTVTFTAGNPAAGEGVVLAFAGHLAKSTPAPTGWGDGQGAGDINGAPYHWAYEIVKTDTGEKVAKGARDRSIMIRRTGHIQIVKACVNADGSTTFPTDFPFTSSSPSSVGPDGLPPSFTLDCDENGTVEQSSVIVGGSGQYTVTESPLAGYAVTNIACTIFDAQGNEIGPKTVNITTTDPDGSLPVTNPYSVTAAFDFAAGETVRCVFTNTKPDAYIALSPLEATNLLNVPHVITATVKQNLGDGNGYVNAPNGTTVTFTLPAGSPPAQFVGPSTCNTTGGTCTVTIVSAAKTDVTIHASTSLSVLGITLNRATGDDISLDSEDAIKHYVPPSPAVLKIVKCVINDNGATAGPTDFLFADKGNALVWPVPPDGGTVQCPTGTTASAGFLYTIPLQSDANGVIPVTFNITETLVLGYHQVSATGCSGTMSTSGQQGTCTFVNDDDAPEGRMTGGGSIFTAAGDTPPGGVRITHGFELHCNKQVLPNNLEINWDGNGGSQNNFHLTKLDAVTCLDTSLHQAPPQAPFDTYIGKGTGSLNNGPANEWTIEFTLTDDGEPGSQDTAKYKIYKKVGQNTIVALEIVNAKFITKGNQQAH